MIADWYSKKINGGSKIDIITNSKILQNQYTGTYDSLNDLKGKVRKTIFVNARRDYIWILDNLGYKCVTTAKFLECDHSTIVYHLQDIKDKFSVKPREKALMIDKYKTLLKDPMYVESLQEMERKYLYTYKN